MFSQPSFSPTFLYSTFHPSPTFLLFNFPSPFPLIPEITITMCTSRLQLPRNTLARIMRSSYRTLGSPLRPSTVIVIPVKHHHSVTSYEDYEKDEKQPKPTRAASHTRYSAIISSEDDHEEETVTAKSRVDKRAKSMALVKRSHKLSPTASR
jgi:hypothetical protein